MRYVILLLAVALGVLGVGGVSWAATQSSVSQYGITWTFDHAYEVGQFANGDYWVIGPITLTGITATNEGPVVRASLSGQTTRDATNVTVNGSMINPTPAIYPDQGFDTRIAAYSEALNIARKGGSPLSASNTRSVPAGSSICSASSRFNHGSGDHAMLLDFAVLTVLPSAPAAGSFRPPYTGTDKTIHWNKSQLNYSILKKLTPVAGMSSPTSAGLTRPWVVISTDYNTARDFAPFNNQPEYDRDAGFVIQRSLLELHQNYSDATKELAYVRFVQLGIDIYAGLRYGKQVMGGVPYDVYQGNTWTKTPLIIAALALNDANIAHFCNPQHVIYALPPPMFYQGGVPLKRIGDFANYVRPVDANTQVNDQYLSESRPRYAYSMQMVGLPDWGAPPTNTGGGMNWDCIYRNVRYVGMAGNALGLFLTTGAKALANDPAWFDYFDRAYSTYENNPATAGQLESYITLFWNANRSLGATPWTRSAPFAGPGRISTKINNSTLDIHFTDNVTAAGGGLTIATTGPAITATYVSGNGSTNHRYNLSRPVVAGEVLSYSYAQPGNGWKATQGGLNVPSVTAMPIVNYLTPESGGGGGRMPGGGGGGDTTPPTMVITGPTSNIQYSTSNAAITIAGTASDAALSTVRAHMNGATVGVIPLAGTTSWSGNVTLNAGVTNITVIARDTTGNEYCDLLSVTYTPTGGGPENNGDRPHYFD